MVFKLRISAGTSLETMVPITSNVNTNTPHKLSSDVFEGVIVAHIKNFVEDGDMRESEYFLREDRRGITWSIQVQGRFLKPYSGDDILFGNVFDRPLKLPWGAGVALKFMKFIDPTLEHDLKSPRPWALSPMVSTMPHFMHQRLHAACSSPLQSDDMEFESLIQAFPPAEPIKDQTLELSKALRDKTSSSSSAPSISFNNAAARKSYFSSAAHRQAFVFGPSDVLTIDFCYGFLEFSPKLVLRIPGGLTFDLMHYWDGQMVQFVCCERKKPTNDQSADDGKPWGRVFWAISIEPYEDEEVVDKIN